MTETRIAVEKTLRRMGANGTKKGFWCLLWATFIALRDPTILCEITHRLYPEVAGLCNMSVTNVARDLRTAVDYCWINGDRDILNEVAGRKLAVKPSVGEFLDYLCAYLRYQGY